MKRVFLIVLDSLGIGNAPDADAFGDVGANTLLRISRSEKFNIPTLKSLGLGNIEGIDYIEKCDTPKAKLASLEEISRGKDTTVGHWEIAGVISEYPLPTYPKGFPNEVIEEFEAAIGRGVLCNKPYSGTEVIRDFGDEHIRSGEPIVYTSADSVFQIAAHTDVIPLDALYSYCETARKMLTGRHGVGRVIARPFITENGKFKRTADRRDYSIEPPEETMLDRLSKAGYDVIAVGKIRDIFAGRGICEHIPTHSNGEGMAALTNLLDRDFSGLCFANLVDFDMLYGHREDIDGYATALTEFDAWLSGFLPKLSDEDLLIITADHGCDPGDGSTDHSRERVPFIMYSKDITPENLGCIRGFGYVATRVENFLSKTKNKGVDD